MSDNPTINRSMAPLDWFFLVLLSMLWGGAFFFNGVAVRELPTFTIVFFRVSLGAAALFLIMRMTGRSMPVSKEAWACFMAMGLLNNVIPFSLIVWGQGYIASGLASIFNATTPIFTVIVAHWMTSDEKITSGRMLGMALGFAGVVVIIGSDLLKEIGVDVWAQVACLGASLSYGIAASFGRRFGKMGMSPIATATGQVTASSVILLPLMLAVDRPWNLPVPGLEVVGSLAGIAILSTALAYILFFRILATSGATNVLLVTFLVPVSAVLLGFLVLEEELQTRHFMGMALIGAGLAAIDGRLWTRRRGADHAA